MATVDVTRIAANLAPLAAYATLRPVGTNLATPQTRLASGLRCTAADEVSIGAAGTGTITAGSTQVQALLAQLRTQAAAVEAERVSTNASGQSTQASSPTTTQPGDAAGPADTGTARYDAAINALQAGRPFKQEALATQRLNAEAAYTRIMNADMAEEQINANKYAILQQTATTMLAQANQAPQFLLQLFR